jgi:short-subunit dehydrogenase involved in D-alanine esterification of teichoic acids
MEGSYAKLGILISVAIAVAASLTSFQQQNANAFIINVNSGFSDQRVSSCKEDEKN